MSSFELFIIIFILILLVILNIIFIILNIKKNNKLKKIEHNITDESLINIKQKSYEEAYNYIILHESEKIEQDVSKIYQEKEQELSKEYLQARQDYINKKEAYDTEIAYLNQLLSEKRCNLEDIIHTQKQLIDNEINNYRKESKEQIDREISEYYSKKNIEENNNFEMQIKSHNEQIINLKNEINQITDILNEYRQKREAINSAILRERELKEKEDFYRIVISDNDIQDIQVLRQIENEISNKEALNKLIYDVFIKRPALEMIKRVLNGNSPSGIYKITFIPTGESYIGKSTDVSKRWTEHIKSSLNIGTIAHSSLHSKMSKEGLWKFTFELLEEVPKEKLSEREKYYIDFYNTKKMGLNQKDA